MCQSMDKIRVHGLQAPLERMQLLAWTVVFSSIILFFGLCIPFEPSSSRVMIYLIIYIIIFVIGFAAFLRVSLMDPGSAALRFPSDNQPVVPGELVRTCRHCNISMGPQTKHCNICRKCIDEFDHHCLYLNTCVGKPNYRHFFVLITCCTIIMGFQLFVIAYLAATYNNVDHAKKISDRGMSGVSYLSVLIITGIVPLIGFLLILSLLAFHIYISLLGTTTYRWILDRRRIADEKKTKEEEKRQADNAVELQKKQEEERQRWRDERAGVKAERERRLKREDVLLRSHGESGNNSSAEPSQTAPSTTDTLSTTPTTTHNASTSSTTSGASSTSVGSNDSSAHSSNDVISLGTASVTTISTTDITIHNTPGRLSTPTRRTSTNSAAVFPAPMPSTPVPSSTTSVTSLPSGGLTTSISTDAFLTPTSAGAAGRKSVPGDSAGSTFSHTTGTGMSTEERSGLMLRGAGLSELSSDHHQVRPSGSSDADLERQHLDQFSSVMGIALADDDLSLVGGGPELSTIHV